MSHNNDIVIESFDIFDSTLTRIYFKPTDLFYFLGQELVKNGIIRDPNVFLTLRISAEKTARRNTKEEEIVLDQIYRELKNRLNVTQTDLNLIRERELTFERNSYRPIKKIVEQLDRDSVFISDIYLPVGFIKETFNELMLPFKQIYVSSEYLKTKWTGSLFDIVLKDLKILPEGLHHTGDNQTSDFLVPRSLGISATHFGMSKPNRYENLVYKNFKKKPILSLLAGSMKSSRLSRALDSIPHQIVWNTATDVIGPFLFDYVYWIMENCRKLGIGRVYFMSRDGQILHKIALEIKKRFDFDFEVKYIYGSRKSFNLPSTTNIDDLALNWIFDGPYCSITSICRRLDIDPIELKSEIPATFFSNSNANLSYQDRKRIGTLLKSSNKFKSIIVNKAKEERELTLDYLLYEGFSDNLRIALADIGWRGRVQHSLSKILSIGSIYPKEGIVGFYVGLDNQFAPFGNDRYLTYFGKADLLRVYNAVLLEVFLSADHGTCLGYQSNGNEQPKPILRSSTDSRMIEWGVRIQQEGIMQFVKEFASSVIDNKVQFNTSSITDEVNSLLKYFIRNPSFLESVAYGRNLEFYVDQEEEFPYLISREVPLKQVIRFPFASNRSNTYGRWYEGSFRLTFRNKFNIAKPLLLLRRMGSRLRSKI